MFECKKCGKCCTRFKNFPEGDKWRIELDSGDGTCKYFDRSAHLCTIYESRPIICSNVMYYNSVLKDTMTREKFDEFLNKYCELIRSEKI